MQEKSQGSTAQSNQSDSDELSTAEKTSAAAAAATASSKLPKLSYSTHVQNIGWQNAVTYDLASPNASVFAGASSKALRMEARKLSVSWEGHQGGVETRSHVQDLGWIS